MIPYLFESTYPNSARTFVGHGIGDLVEATDIVAEENGEEGHEWELSFKYPETGELFSRIALNNIVVAKANSYQGLQAFRIYSITKELNHTISVACQHISYDLANIPVKPMETIGASESLVAMKANMINVCNSNNFIFNTDVTMVYSSSKTYKKGDIILYGTTLYKCTTDILTPEAWNSSHWTSSVSTAEKDSVTIKFEEPKSALKVLLDGDDSIRGKYGGDIVTDNYNISLYSIGGSDRGMSIEYGVDLIELSQERNITDMITGILPYYVRAKDTKLDIGVERSSTVTETNTSMVLNTEAYTLEVGSKYTLKFTPENTPGGTAILKAAAGFSQSDINFNMDGIEKEYNIVPSSNITVAAGTDLVISNAIPYETSGGETIYSPIGAISSFTITKNFIEPIIYGDVVNGPGTYDVQRISSVNLTEYFQDSNDEPTAAQVTAKAQEWVNAEEIGIPEVSLTLSYADVDGKDVRLYDAVRVIFSRMGIDVTSKVTRYKYDVLAERCTEIDVGQTKESSIFTLQDASRIRRGLLPPDRIGKDSLEGNKLKKGSVGSDQLAAGSVRGWHMPDNGIDHDKLRGDSVGIDNLIKDTGDLPDGWCKDPVLKSVPNNVYGGYNKKVGYLFDPSLGVPPDNMCGWTYTTPQGEKVFKSILKQGTAQEWQQKIPYDQGSGVGYVLDPDCFFKNDIHGNHLKDGTVDTQQISDGAIDENKLSSVVDPSTGRKNLKSKITAWENLHDNVGPEMETWYEATVEGSSYITMPYLSVSHQLYITNNDIAMVGPSAQYGSYHFRPNKLKLNIGGSGASDLGVFLIAGGSDITIDVSSIASNASGALDSLNTLTCRLYGGTDYHFDQYYGDLNTIDDILTDHENRIAALEANS